jgi:uncharacterized protein YkwD
MLLVPAAAAAACPDEDLVPRREADLPDYERAVLCLVNEERVRRDRSRLSVDRRLARAGERHARDMVERGYFSHESLGGLRPVDRLRRVGYGSSRRSWMLGEVLAWGTSRRARPRSIVAAWMDSPGHRAAILEPAFDEAGAGAATGTPRRARGGGVTVAVEFGRIR